MNALNPDPPRPMTLAPKRAEDLMSPGPLSIEDTLSLPAAMAFLIEHAISGAPVVNAVGEIVGVLSQTDLLIHHREALAGRESVRPAPQPEDGTRVRDVMTPGVFAVGRDTPSERVVEKLCELKVHRLFVVDASGVLVGVITPMDLLRRLTP